ncbi:MAG: RidA family protein [Leptolyngbya sp. SIO3F4]|nr:RidA family protein [Leptolyngbya sp. SIO3F4]
MKQVIETPDAPAPIGPYSQAILANDTLYVSGQIGLNPATGKLVSDTVETETEQVLKNLQAVLRAADMDMGNVVKCSIFLSNMQQFGRVNHVYATYFTENPPARETVEVSHLPLGVCVEISCIAVR